MKKIWICLISIVMIMGLMSGCGKSEEKGKEAALENGYWVISEMVMEGTAFTKEEMEGIFGAPDTIMVLAFNEDQTVDGVYFGEYLSSGYTGTLESFTVDLYGETAQGKVAEDGSIVLTLQDGSSFTFVNQEEMPESLASNPWVTYDPYFEAEETCAMSNFMNYGWYVVEDEIVYGLTHGEGGVPMLGATPFKMEGDFPQFEEPKILNENGAANYICQYEDELYYVLDYQAICKTKMDGSKSEVLYEGACDYLQIHEGKLYFSDENYHVMSMDLDGKNPVTVVDKEVYYPYFIGSDWMIFQDDADGEALHLYNVTHGTELNITYEPSYCPILDDHYLYYTYVMDEMYYLARIDMSDPETFYYEGSDMPLVDSHYLIDEESIYTSNNNIVAKADWNKLTDTHDSVKVMEMYVSKDYSIHHEFDDQGLISGKYLMSKEKSGGTSFR